MELNNPAKFAEQLVKHAVANGFGSLSKRDLELLIFFLLEHDGAISRTSSSFEISHAMNLTVTKVKSLRRDAASRWAGLTGSRQDFLKEVLTKVLSTEQLESAKKHTANSDGKDGFIAVWIEHPGDRLEFARAVQEAGGLPRHDSNPEILLVRFDVLTALAGQHLPTANIESIYTALRALGPVTEELKALLRKDVKKISIEDLRSVLNNLGAEAATGLLNISASRLLGIYVPGLAAH